jgi:hypothetical protein
MKVRNEQVLRMFLLSALEPDDARVALRRIAEHTGKEAAELRRIRQQGGGHVQTGRAGFGLHHYDAVHQWALRAMDQLHTADRDSAGAAADRAGWRPGPDSRRTEVAPRVAARRALFVLDGLKSGRDDGGCYQGD